MTCKLLGFTGEGNKYARQLKKFEGKLAMMADYQMQYGESAVFVMTFVDLIAKKKYSMRIDPDEILSTEPEPFHSPQLAEDVIYLYMFDGNDKGWETVEDKFDVMFGVSGRLRLHNAAVLTAGYTAFDFNEFPIIEYLSKALKKAVDEGETELSAEVLGRLQPCSAEVIDAAFVSSMDRFFNCLTPSEVGWEYEDNEGAANDIDQLGFSNVGQYTLQFSFDSYLYGNYPEDELNDICNDWDDFGLRDIDPQDLEDDEEFGEDDFDDDEYFEEDDDDEQDSDDWNDESGVAIDSEEGSTRIIYEQGGGYKSLIHNLPSELGEEVMPPIEGLDDGSLSGLKFQLIKSYKYHK